MKLIAYFNIIILFFCIHIYTDQKNNVQEDHKKPTRGFITQSLDEFGVGDIPGLSELTTFTTINSIKGYDAPIGSNLGGSNATVTGGAGDGSGDGGNVILTGGTAGTTGDGGDIDITAADGGTTSGDGGNITLTAGNGNGGGIDGNIVFSGDTADFTAVTNADFTGVNVIGLIGSTATSVYNGTGDANVISEDHDVNIIADADGSAAGSDGKVVITTGLSCFTGLAKNDVAIGSANNMFLATCDGAISENGGDINITSGDGGAINGNGGNITITGGSGVGTGDDGIINLTTGGATATGTASGDIGITSTGEIDLTAGTTVDINGTTTVTIDSTSSSVDVTGGVGVNVTATTGNVDIVADSGSTATLANDGSINILAGAASTSNIGPNEISIKSEGDIYISSSSGSVHIEGLSIDSVDVKNVEGITGINATGDGVNGGNVTMDSGSGSAATTAGNDGGDGGTASITAGAAGAGMTTGDGGAGGNIELTASNGGAGGGTTGNGGDGGNIILTAGTGGTTTGGSIGADGDVQIVAKGQTIDLTSLILHLLVAARVQPITSVGSDCFSNFNNSGISRVVIDVSTPETVTLTLDRDAGTLTTSVTTNDGGTAITGTNPIRIGDGNTTTVTTGDSGNTVNIQWLSSGIIDAQFA